MIAFVHKPSLAFLSIADMQLDWLQEVPREHEVFEQFSKVNVFDYFYINQILVIPDPIPIPRVNWNRDIFINGLKVECEGSFLAFFHFNLVKENLIMASSLTLPEYEFLRKSIC